MVAPMNRKWNWSRGYLLLGSLLMPLCGAMPAEAQDCGIAGGSNLVIMLPVTSTADSGPSQLAAKVQRGLWNEMLHSGRFLFVNINEFDPSVKRALDEQSLQKDVVESFKQSPSVETAAPLAMRAGVPFIFSVAVQEYKQKEVVPSQTAEEVTVGKRSKKELREQRKAEREAKKAEKENRKAEQRAERESRQSQSPSPQPEAATSVEATQPVVPPVPTAIPPHALPKMGPPGFSIPVFQRQAEVNQSGDDVLMTATMTETSWTKRSARDTQRESDTPKETREERAARKKSEREQKQAEKAAAIEAVTAHVQVTVFAQLFSLCGSDESPTQVYKSVVMTGTGSARGGKKAPSMSGLEDAAIRNASRDIVKELLRKPKAQ